VIALHAVWSHDSRLCVWSEEASLPAATDDLIAGLEGLDIVPASPGTELRR
jgi:hypothetical protein